MMPLICPGCGGRMDIEQDRELVPFSCPYCAAALTPQKNGQAVFLKAGPASMRESASKPGAEAAALLQSAQAESDPVKRYALLKKAEEAAPEDLRVQKALLLHGRLHERDKRKVDFSIIKCYLLHIFEEPEAYPPSRREEKLTELFSEDRLQKAMAMAPDPEAFLKDYLSALSAEYINLFLMGSSRHMKPLFGLSLGGKPARLLAEPASVILSHMLAEQALAPLRRETLARAFYEAFTRTMDGETTWLDEKLGAQKSHLAE